jgi:DNA modification methylase
VKPYYQDEMVTLYHGDCLEITDWLQADLLVTDPPYGMAYVSGKRHKDDRVAVAGDDSTESRDAALQLWGGRPALVFGNWRIPRPTLTRQIVHWWKRKAGPGMGDVSMPWAPVTEEIYVIGDGWIGRRRHNVIPTDDQRGNPYGIAAQVGHPTPKPVGLLEQLIECAPQGVIADPFAGGGSTLLAARNLGREAIGVEIDERYCEIIANRLAQGVLI